MATQVNGEVQPITLQMLKMFVDTVPSFNGNSDTLPSFISSCDYMFNTFTTTDQTIQNYLIRVVQTKLVGRAQLLVGCRTELTSWSSIKSASAFKNEPPMDFGKRLQVLRSSLAQKLTLSEPSSVIRTAMLKQYEGVCLRAFIRGLPDEDVNITLDELLDIEEIFDPKTDRNPDKINILSDIQIAPAPVQETDEMTVHTAVENPVLEIPFTENVINRYLNQIVILQKASYHYHIVRSKPLEHNNRLTLYLSNNIEEEIVKFFKEYVDPMKKYYTVPSFNGNSDTLPSFISSCDYMFNTFTTTDQTIQNYLIRVVQTKLVVEPNY
nr:unnamed protein product [Callosobruchus analis]